MKFGNHGTIVPARTQKTNSMGEIEERDTEFVGNRWQFRFRKKNPFAPIADRSKVKFQKNRFDEKRKQEDSTFKRTLRVIAAFFKAMLKLR